MKTGDWSASWNLHIRLQEVAAIDGALAELNNAWSATSRKVPYILTQQRNHRTGNNNKAEITEVLEQEIQLQNVSECYGSEAGGILCNRL